MDQSSSKASLSYPQLGLPPDSRLFKSFPQAHIPPLHPAHYHPDSFNTFHSSPSQPILTSSPTSNPSDTLRYPPSHQPATTHYHHALNDDCEDDHSDSGSDHYTSDSDSEPESSLTPKQRAKRDRLRAERDAVKPSYYYGEKEFEEEAIKKGINRPKLKRKGLRGVPVFEPSMEQFQDFYSYVNQIDRWGMRSGIAKVIPPKEWSDQLPHLGTESLRTDGGGQMLRTARIKSPISQVIQGSRGLFRVMNVAKRKNYNALEWYDLANTAEHRPPDFFNKMGDALSADHSGDQLTDGTFRSMRSTRSSRRSTSHIAPISKKVPARRPKVSQPIPSAIDTTSSTGSPRQVGLEGNLSPSKLAPVPENHSSVPNPADSQSTLASGAPERSNQDLSLKPSVSGPAHVECTDHQTTTPAESPEERYSQTHQNGAEEAKPAGLLPTDISPPPSTMSVAQATPDQCSATLPSTTSEQVSEKKQKRSVPVQPTAEEWAQFVACYDQLPYGASKEDYTVEVCKEIEQEYWRTIGNGGEPIYGADTTGSLFDERTKNWNVANLDNLLTRLKLKKKIPGVNTPYLYFGTWRATFAWHVEDADLYSINYIHFGAPKFWYSIPQEHNSRFEDFMSSSFAKERRTCPEFLRHKAFLASPATLQSVGIQLNKVVHLPGEIIITYPYGYHSGFNLGYNCAESVNFANEAWIEKGKNAKFCKCIDDAVTIDVEAWLKEHEESSHKEQEAQARALQKAERQSQKAKRQEQKQPKKKRPLCEQPGEPPGGKPKKKSKLMDGAVAKPGSEAVKAAVKMAGPTCGLAAAPVRPSLDEPKVAVKKAASMGGLGAAPARPSLDEPKVAVKKAAPTGSRQGAGQDGQPKKRKAEPSGKRPPTGGESSASGAKRGRAAPKTKLFPCALCPDMSEEMLLRIIEEPAPSAGEAGPGCAEAGNRADGQLGADAGGDGNLLAKPPSQAFKPAGKPKVTKYAHRLCCMFTPSTYIEILPTGEEVVRGFEAIEKARWALKCQLCKEKMGTKVQCTQSQKCAKACHVTCGLKTGAFFLDMLLVRGAEKYSLLDPSSEGSLPEGFDIGQDPQLVVLCKQHNPVYKRAEALRKAQELSERMTGLTAGQPIKVRTPKGVFQVFFLSRDELSQTVRVTFEDGHAGEVAYNKVSFLSEEDYRKAGFGDCGKEGVEGGEKEDVGWESNVASGVERRGDLRQMAEWDAWEHPVSSGVKTDEVWTGVGGQESVGNGGVGKSGKTIDAAEGGDSCGKGSTTRLNDNGPEMSVVKPDWGGIKPSSTSLKPPQEEWQSSTTPVSSPELAEVPPFGPTASSSSLPVRPRLPLLPPPPPSIMPRREPARCEIQPPQQEWQPSTTPVSSPELAEVPLFGPTPSSSSQLARAPLPPPPRPLVMPQREPGRCEISLTTRGTQQSGKTSGGGERVEARVGSDIRQTKPGVSGTKSSLRSLKPTQEEWPPSTTPVASPESAAEDYRVPPFGRTSSSSSQPVLLRPARPPPVPVLRQEAGRCGAPSITTRETQQSGKTGSEDDCIKVRVGSEMNLTNPGWSGIQPSSTSLKPIQEWQRSTTPMSCPDSEKEENAVPSVGLKSLSSSQPVLLRPPPPAPVVVTRQEAGRCEVTLTRETHQSAKTLPEEDTVEARVGSEMSPTKTCRNGIESSSTSLKPTQQEWKPSSTPVSAPEPEKDENNVISVEQMPLSSSRPISLRPPPPPPVVLTQQEAGRCEVPLMTRRETQQSGKTSSEDWVKARVGSEINLTETGWSGTNSSSTSLQLPREEWQPSTRPVSCSGPEKEDNVVPPAGRTPISFSQPVTLPQPSVVPRQEAGRCEVTLSRETQQAGRTFSEGESVKERRGSAENEGVVAVQETNLDRNGLHLLADLSAADLLYQRYQNGDERHQHEKVIASESGADGHESSSGGCEGVGAIGGGDGGSEVARNEARTSNALMAGLIDSRLL